MAIIVFIFAIVLIGMLAGGSLLIFFGFPLLEKKSLAKQYPVQAPGWNTRFTSAPPFDANVHTLSDGLRLFLNRAVAVKKYNKKELKNKLNGLYIKFIRSQNPDGKRYFTDEYGRTFAGDHQGDFIRLAVLDDDKLGDTAFFHELGHEAHEMEGIVDYNHEDDQMWKEIVGYCKDQFRS